MRIVRVRGPFLASFATGALLLSSGLAFADDPPPPGGVPVPAPAVDPAATAPPPARPRPPEPPPPGVEIPGWDVHHRDRAVGLPPPFPPPDPFDPRSIQFSHLREVSADGRIKEVRRVPQWVDVLSRAQIEEWRPKDFGEMLRWFPNVGVADGGSPFLAMPVIRGLGGERVRIMTDGVWPTTQALGVAGATISLWDPESTERVEVYHGPGAYLRGAEAGGGVINVVPRRPSRHECLEAWGGVSSSFNSADRRFRERAEVEVGQGRLAGLFGFTGTDTDDRETPSGDLDPSSFRSYAADAAVDYFLDNQTTLGVTGQFVRAEDIRSPIGDGDAFTQPLYQRTFLGLTLSSVNVGPIFHGTRISLAFDQFFADDEQDTLSLTSHRESEDEVERWDFSLQGQLYLLPCHDTWAELTVAYARLERTEQIVCDVCDPSDDVVIAETRFEAEEVRVKGLVEDEWHDGNMDFHLGARVDLVYVDDSRTGENDLDVLFGVAGGVTRHLSDCMTVYGNGSFGWRHPSIFEMFSTTVLNQVTVFGNPDLDDELSWAAELGIKHGYFDKWSFQAAAFVHGYDDFIGRRDVGVDQQWSNVGDVVLYGLELTWAWRLDPCRCEGLEAFGSAGITGTSDDDVVEEMPVHGRVGLRYANCWGPRCGIRRWFVEGSLRGAAEAEHDDGSGGDAFVTADVLAGVGISRGGRRAVWLNLGFTNLFDEDYTETYAHLPAAGRSLVASVSIEF